MFSEEIDHLSDLMMQQGDWPYANNDSFSHKDPHADTLALDTEELPNAVAAAR